MMKGFASDYIKAKRQNAIYMNIHANAETTGNTVNPVKKNGYYYNNMLNVCVPNNCNTTSCPGGVLTNARSYQLRSDFKGGNKYNTYVCKCNKEQIYNVDGLCSVTEVDGKNVIDCLCSTCAFK